MAVALLLGSGSESAQSMPRQAGNGDHAAKSLRTVASCQDLTPGLLPTFPTGACPSFISLTYMQLLSNTTRKEVTE
jgi:hypothetical protein